MGLYYSLIKTKNGERYNLWGRNGDRYTPNGACHGLADHEPPAVPFRFTDLYTREEMIEHVWDNIYGNSSEATIEHCEELVDDILRWCGNDEVIHVSDHYYEYLDYHSDGHYYTDRDGRIIILTGSAYIDDRERIQTALDAILNNSKEE